MSKVLVFESDPVFAGELRTELGRLGMAVQVVDDGNVGLSVAQGDRPDLILLSIELPRMNGFSVCNKLKKDPTLKDVPLIIMSSESSEETFEQHRKLRTRAEDYVHKPIAFGELYEHVRALVHVDAPSPDSGSGIALDEAMILDDMDTSAIATSPPSSGLDADRDTIVGSARPTPVEPMAAAHAAEMHEAPPVDPEIDAFIGGAFDRLLSEDDEERTVIKPSGALMAELRAAAAARPSDPVSPTPQPSVASVPPAPRSVRPPTMPPGRVRVSEPPPRGPIASDSAELERLRVELGRAKDEVVALTRDTTTSATTIARLESDLTAQRTLAMEANRYKREADDLRARSASSPSIRATSATSSREFLDLREALNAKDKEILGLRDQMSKKDRELLDLRDQLLRFERDKANQEDKLLALEREKADAESAVATAQSELSALRGLEAEVRAKADELARALADREARMAAAEAAHREATTSAARAAKETLDAAIATERDRAARALAEATAAADRSKAEELGRLADQHATRLRQVETDAAAASAGALAAREAELTAERDAALAEQASSNREAFEGLANEHREALNRLANEHREALAAQAKANGEALDAEAQKHAGELAAQAETHDRALAEAQATWASEKAEADAKAADAEARANALATRVIELEGRLAETGVAVAAMREEAESNAAGRATLEAERDALASRIEAADDRIEMFEARVTELENEVTAARDDTALAQKEIADRTVELQKARETFEEAQGKIRELERRIAAAIEERDDVAAESVRIGEELARERTRLEKARIKWGEDRASLERARGALAVAIEQIQATEIASSISLRSNECREESR